MGSPIPFVGETDAPAPVNVDNGGVFAFMLLSLVPANKTCYMVFLDVTVFNFYRTLDPIVVRLLL